MSHPRIISLDSRLWFPDPGQAWRDGLVAAASDGERRERPALSVASKKRPPPAALAAAKAEAAALGDDIDIMVADARYGMVGPLRAVAATLLWPLQQALMSPVQAWEALTDSAIYGLVHAGVEPR
mgnify:CR=1 FL=1